jgi:hypothetical protein
MEINMKQASTTRHGIWLALILLLGALALTPVTWHDLSWTTYLRDHTNEAFESFMSDSVFEMEAFGGGDIAFIYVIVVAFAYLLSWVPELQSEKDRKRFAFFIRFLNNRGRLKERLISWRHFLGMHVIVGLCNTVFMVHALKWVMGRARPYKIFKGKEVFTDWFEVGPLFISQGYYHGSFPSGHTATVFVFMALAYALIVHGRRRSWKIGGVGIAIFAWGSGLAMTIARSMTEAHWLTDSVFILFANWALLHAIYFFGVHVPQREEYFRATGKQLPVPFMFELKVGWYLFVATLGFTTFFFGVRALLRGEMWFLMALIPAGIYFMYFGWRRCKQLGFFHWKKWQY